MTFGVVLAAAGIGKRMQAKEPKQFIKIAGKSVLYHAVNVFYQLADVQEIVVVVSTDEIARTKMLLQEFSNVVVTHGGKERQESVHAGLSVLKNIEYVLIHDAARPFVSKELIQKLMEQVKQKKAVIPAVPVKDTIKIVDEKGKVISTPSRQSLWAVQTPQAFHLSSILMAHQRAEQHGFLGTDDAMLMEWAGEEVYTVLGDYENIKITTPEDLQLGETILKRRQTDV